MTEYNNELRKLRQDIDRQQMLRNKLASLERQQADLTDRVYELDRIRVKEQEDVDKLEAGSLATFFYKLFGKHEERLEKEEEEAYAAAVKFDAAMRELEDVRYEVNKLIKEIGDLSGCEARYGELLEKKEQELKARGGETARAIFAAEQEITGLDAQLTEIDEAIRAGERALSMADAVAASLSKAESWSTYDLMGGGMLADMAKHSHLDDAQRQIDRMQQELRHFRTELADIEIRADLHIQIDGFDRFADYFFDNLFTDWAVMDKISRSQGQVNSVRSQIYGVLRRLKDMQSSMEARQVQLDRMMEEMVLKSEE